MPVTRGNTVQKEGNIQGDSSLVERVRQLSPGSHGSLGSRQVSALGSQSPSSQTESDMDNNTGQVDLKQIYQLVLEVKNSLNSHKDTVSHQIEQLNRRFESHLENQLTILKNGLKQQIQDSISDIQSYVDTEVGRLSSQIEDLSTRVATLEASQTPELDPETSVIMSMVPQAEGEVIQQVAEDIIHNGLNSPEVTVVCAVRLRQRERRAGQRQQGPPLVKVQLPNLETKKRVLRAKTRLRDTEQWSRVWIRSSKPHIERLMDLNFRKILEVIPGGNNMTVTNSGRIINKTH